jgi:predicted RNA-binding protein Jag
VDKKIVTMKNGTATKTTPAEGSAYPDGLSFFVDVNGYQEAALETLKNLAKVMGERARSLRASVELEPMSAYERMIVHSFFQDASDLETSSTGDGERRRVVIKYTGVPS